MGYDYTVIQVICWIELPEKKETLPDFCENIDPDNRTQQCGIGSPEIHRNYAG